MALFPTPPWFALPWFVLWVLGALLTRARLRDLPSLPEAGAADPIPPVTVCIPARNEEAGLGPALDAWLAQDLPGLRILVVDDGSTDGTPRVLAAREARDPVRLRGLRCDHLPPGWLGKNHALHLATGQPEALASPWLVLADADGVPAPDLLRRCFAFLREHPADLLTLLPGLETETLAERVFLPAANLGFLWLLPLRRIPEPGNPFHCGVGAFMLLRREAYDRAGGHEAAPMAAIDDMGLAERVKTAGGVNRVALGGKDLRLRMYGGLGDILRGLRKNLVAWPWAFRLSPLFFLGALAVPLGPLILAAGGHGWAGLLLWLLGPTLMGEAHQRYTGKAMDPAWMLWPLQGPILAAAVAWALYDRLRGVNHWRGREIPLAGRGG